MVDLKQVHAIDCECTGRFVDSGCADLQDQLLALQRDCSRLEDELRGHIRDLSEALGAAEAQQERYRDALGRWIGQYFADLPDQITREAIATVDPATRDRLRRWFEVP